MYNYFMRKILLRIGVLTTVVLPAIVATSCGKSLQEYEPDVDKFDLSGKTVISENQFANMHLPTNFIIPDSVTSIESGAFLNSSFGGNFIIPESVKSISNTAFSGARFQPISDYNTLIGVVNGGNIGYKKLADDFSFNGRVTIDDWAFSFMRGPIAFNENFNLPTYITSIGKFAFERALLPANFELPDSLETIGSGAFSQAIIPVGFTIPNSVTTIESNAFFMTRLPQSFVIPSSVTSIGRGAFGMSSFTGVVSDWYTYYMLNEGDFSFIQFNSEISRPDLPVDLGEYSYIPKFSFAYRTLPDDFKIPSSITTISSSAFSCSTLPNNFTIPSSVTSIGNDVFYGAQMNSLPISRANPIHWDGHPDIIS